MKNYRYDMIGADIEYHVHGHPQKVMRELGYNFIKSEPVPAADCWWFRVDNEDEVPKPGFLDELPDDFKFSDEFHRKECVI